MASKTGIQKTDANGNADNTIAYQLSRKTQGLDRPMSQVRYVSTAQVAEALGVSVSTVKRWVDDGVLPAHKTAGGHRKLLLTDVLRIVREGTFPRLELGRLGLPSTAGKPRHDLLRSELLSALVAGDNDKVSALILSAYRDGMPIDELGDRLIGPVMRQVGHEWETDAIDVMHEHRATLMIAAALVELRTHLEHHAKTDRPVAVGAAPEDDPYSLSSQLCQLVLLEGGWDAVDLGPNTPIFALRRALKELKPKLVWLSVNFLERPSQFVEQYQQFYAAAQAAGACVAVGGHAMTAEMSRAIPYTTCCGELRHLSAFAQALLPSPGLPKRGRPPKQ